MWQVGGQWRNCGCLVKPDESIELVGQDRLEIVALAFSGGTIDHADRPLQTWLGQPIPQASVMTQISERRTMSGLVEQRF